VIAEAVVAVLLLASGVATLAAALGLLRLRDFFMRMHAPAVCYTLGCWSVGLASVIHFSGGRIPLALHGWLVVVVLAITAPVTTVLLARAGLFRARQAGEDVPGPFTVAPGQGETQEPARRP
jgi:multicomponent K+:H+ antiporter subunit G